jgi:signal peptidase II
LILAIIALSILADHAVKWLAKTYLLPAGRIDLLGGLVRLEYSENIGALLSLGAGLSDALRFWLLIVFVGVFLTIALVFALWTRELTTAQTIGFALFIGGGLGNWIDRVFNEGRVADFVVLGFPRLHTGVFNLADVWVVAGILVLLVFMPKEEKPQINTDSRG